MDVHQTAQYGEMAELELVAEYAPERINEANNVDWTPLHRAAITGHLDYGQAAAVSFLLSAGANVNKTDNNGRTPLSCTITARVKQLLIDAGGH